jgi:hypothetical protein
MIPSNEIDNLNSKTPSSEVQFFCSCCDEEVEYNGESGDIIDCPYCEEECEVETSEDYAKKRNESYYNILIDERGVE